ncbi:FAD-dependent oxidoreductase [Streptomyces sp. NPDC056835]|uniref:FAD-dependent oxidoreductase n=1 Tax=Streptomyces sp. NPDC056835 TaxID=3345956 RepID=UPI00367408D9
MSTDTFAPRAVVVGAGPVGCLAAQVLARRGYTVEVYEKRGHYVEHGLRYDGRTINLSLSPRGVGALDGYCAPAALDELVVAMEHRVRHEADGRVRAAGYGRAGRRNLSIDRNDLNLLLMRSAGPGVRFVFGARCTGVDFTARRVTFAGRRGGEVQAGYDLLVGADGTHSVVRGRLAEQGLTRSRQRRIGVEYREVTLRPAPGDERMTPTAIHVWPREGFFMVGLPNRDGSLRCTLVLPREGALTFAGLADGEALGAFLRRHFPDAADIHRPGEADGPGAVVSSLSVVTCAPVVHGGSVVLLGDAAHTVAPFLGQGVNLGLEDCAALAGHLEKWPDEQGTALAGFQRERVPEHEAAAALSLANYDELNATGARPAAPGTIPLPTLVNFDSSTYREALDIYSRGHRASAVARPERPTGG